MNGLAFRFLMVGIVVLCASSWALAHAAGDYQALFGQEEKAAARSVKGSVEFAAKLLRAARSLGARKDLQVLLCEKAYEFGLRAPAGYQVAAEAMRMLIEMAPENKAAAQEKLLKVGELRFAQSTPDNRRQAGEELVELLADMGDERAESKQHAEAITLYRRALALATSLRSGRAPDLAGRIKEAAAAQEAERRLADLKARLERTPSNAAVRSALVLALLSDADDPNEAAKLLTGDLDEALRTYVPLAARSVGDLSEAACLDLAGWYVATADKVSRVGKRVLLGRAQACCERYLELHQADDIDRLKAKMLLAELDKAMAAGVRARRGTLTLGKDVTMTLLRIGPGKFVMGSPEAEPHRDGQEGPQRLVTLRKPFYIGVTEVTQAQYEAMMGRNPSKHVGADKPVDNVSWHEAAEFCKKLSHKTGRTVRLPTEAEWEYACRGGTRSAHFFGDDAGNLMDYAWFEENSDQTSHPVGQKKPNPAGLYDMHGNVWEWCSDWYADSYANAGTVDPQGPATGSQRVWRGGSWYNGPKYQRSATRLGVDPESRRGHRGFRVVMEAAATGN